PVDSPAPPRGFPPASTALVRFAAAAPARLEREAIALAVTRHAFREGDPEAGDARQAGGWIAVHDPLQRGFTAPDLFFHQYPVLGFRYDKRLVPPKLLMLERRRLERERAAARGAIRLAAPERRENKNEIAPRLPAPGRSGSRARSGARSRTRSRPGSLPRRCPRLGSSTWCGISRTDGSTSAASC